MKLETLLNISVADNCETGDKIHTITYKQIAKHRLNNNLIIQLTTLTTFKHIDITSLYFDRICTKIVSDFYKQTNSEIHYQSLGLHIKCNISHLMVFSAIFRFRWGVLSLHIDTVIWL